VSHPLTFSPDWLALREPADLAARSPILADELARVLTRAVSVGERLGVLDLATGTGANLRALSPHIRGGQDWTLVDLDVRLLAEAPARTCAWAAAKGWEATGHSGQTFVRGPEIDLTVSTGVLDLRDLTKSSDDAGRPASPIVGHFQGCRLVTGSALLDLLSEPQVAALARLCHHARAVVLFALTYDGRITCAPTEPDDEAIRELVNRHQRTDKGFGLALGPDGTPRTASHFADLGYRVRTEPSDWVLGPEFAELQRQLLAGWAHAACEMAPAQSGTVTAWLARRLAHVNAGRSKLAVGHRDLLATRIE
jgi:hypothetical protein